MPIHGLYPGDFFDNKECIPYMPHRGMPLHSSLGIGPEVTRIIQRVVQNWLDEHEGELEPEIITALRSFYKKFEGSFVTTEETTTFITIPISGYRRTDILFVDINGLDLVEGVDYIRQDNTIRLLNPIEGIGEMIHFIALRAVVAQATDYEALKGDKGDKGEPGEKGDSFTYDDLTEEQKRDITSRLNSFYRKSEASFVTTGITTEITIPIEDYRPIDMLFVDVNGLSLVDSIDYSIDDNKIILSTPIANAGSIVHFISLRAVEVDSYGYEMLKGERGEKGEKGDPGTINYEDLENKPSINSVKLDGDLSLEDLGIRMISNDEIDEIVSG